MKKKESDLKITRHKINYYFDFLYKLGDCIKFIKPTASRILLRDLFRARSLPTV